MKQQLAENALRKIQILFKDAEYQDVEMVNGIVEETLNEIDANKPVEFSVGKFPVEVAQTFGAVQALLSTPTNATPRLKIFRAIDGTKSTGWKVIIFADTAPLPSHCIFIEDGSRNIRVFDYDRIDHSAIPETITTP